MIELKPEGLHLADVVSQPVAVCGRQLIADSSGALYWPSQATLVVADLGLESAPAPANGGTRTADDVRQTLVRLAEVMDRYEPARVVVLGGGPGTGGVAAATREILRILQEDREWVWVAGGGAPASTAELGGSVRDELTISGIVLRHEPAAGWATHEIAGHMHPAARFSMYGYSLRRACFVGNGRRLVMPAFGALAGGRNVLDDAFGALLGRGGLAVWMLGAEGLYPVAPRFLVPD